MRFWDASALVPLLLDEPARPALLGLLERDPQMLVWWASPVECASALARREREGSISLRETGKALERLNALAGAWSEIVASEAVRSAAMRLLRVHALRSADSLQLAAAVVACEGSPADLGFVCLDERLAQAAEREGFARVEPR